jgi:hypothetical protein
MFFNAMLFATHVNVTTFHEDEDGKSREDNETQKNFDHDEVTVKKIGPTSLKHGPSKFSLLL